MNNIFNILIRTISLIVILFILFKIIGKKQISQMNIFDYIMGITIGSIVADITLDLEKNYFLGLIPIGVYFVISIIISYLSLKSLKLRSLFEGREAVIIKNGKIDREVMRKNKLTINNLEREARLMGYFNLYEIDMAYIESNGEISFNPKDKNVTKKDMGLKNKDSGLVYNLIIDGEIIRENLELANIKLSYLEHELKIIGKRKKEILLLTIDSNKKINYYLK